MMFNGLPCGDSDTSDVTKGSGCLPGSCPETVEFYREKLRATTLILRNKEETVRVQGESLRVATARLQALTARTAALQRDLDTRTQELVRLRQSADDSSRRRSDAGADPPAQETEKQRAMVVTLKSNLSIIEDLYRECFYEAAQQEALIEDLREALAGRRRAEGEQAARAHRLATELTQQRQELMRCQDLAVDVENLKSEISNFLNNSNSDSGVWEQSTGASAGAAVDVAEELHDIAAQLRRLQEMLTEECSCPRQDNNALKEHNTMLERETRELQSRLAELQTDLEARDHRVQDLKKQLIARDHRVVELKEQMTERDHRVDELKRQLAGRDHRLEEATEQLLTRDHELEDMKEQLACRQTELMEVRQQVSSAQAEAAVTRALHDDHAQQARCLHAQLANMQGLLEDKGEELARARQQCKAADVTIKNLKNELNQLQSTLHQNSQRESETKTSCPRCGALQAKLDETTALLSSKTQECAALESSAADQRREMLHLQAVSSQCQHLKQRLAALEGEARGRLSAAQCCSLQDQLHQATALLETKERELAAAQQHSGALQARLDALAPELARAQAVADRLQSIEQKLGSEHSVELVDMRRECDALRSQLQAARAEAECHREALEQCELQRRQQETAAARLRDELDRSDRIIKAESKMRSEVSYLTQQVALWRRQLEESWGRVHQLEDELQAARRATAELEACCSSQAEVAHRLEEELCAATARGAELCSESRHVVASVRECMRAQRREYQKKFSEQETHIAQLRQRLERYEPQCGRSLVSGGVSGSAGAGPSVGAWPVELPAPAPPPPRRKRSHMCPCARGRACATQLPERVAARVGASPASPAEPDSPAAAAPAPAPATDRPCCACAPRPESPTELLYSRIEAIQHAILAGQPRWLRASPPLTSNPSEATPLTARAATATQAILAGQPRWLRVPPPPPRPP